MYRWIQGSWTWTELSGHLGWFVSLFTWFCYWLRVVDHADHTPYDRRIHHITWRSAKKRWNWTERNTESNRWDYNSCSCPALIASLRYDRPGTSNARAGGRPSIRPPATPALWTIAPSVRQSNSRTSAISFGCRMTTTNSTPVFGTGSRQIDWRVSRRWRPIVY